MATEQEWFNLHWKAEQQEIQHRWKLLPQEFFDHFSGDDFFDYLIQGLVDVYKQPEDEMKRQVALWLHDIRPAAEDIPP